MNTHYLYCIFLLCSSQTVTPVCRSNEIAKLSESVQTKLKPEVEALREEKPPVICRVLKKSDKDSYHMYVKFIQ